MTVGEIECQRRIPGVERSFRRRDARIHVIGRDLERGGEVGERKVVATAIAMQRAAQVQCRRMARLQREHAIVGLERRLPLALLVKPHRVGEERAHGSSAGHVRRHHDG